MYPIMHPCILSGMHYESDIIGKIMARDGPQKMAATLKVTNDTLEISALK